MGDGEEDTGEGPCPRCNERHNYWQCPHTKALEFFEGSGELRRIEFVNVFDLAKKIDEPTPPYPKLKSVPS
jgi:hypothetical protein